MEVINSFKVCMNMDVSEYMNAHPEFKSVTEVIDSICEKFIKEMSEGPIDEVIKFFALDYEDEAKITNNNFAIGYRALQFNEEEKFANVNFKLDIKTSGPDLENSTLAENIIDSEAADVVDEEANESNVPLD